MQSDMTHIRSMCNASNLSGTWWLSGTPLLCVGVGVGGFLVRTKRILCWTITVCMGLLWVPHSSNCTNRPEPKLPKGLRMDPMTRYESIKSHSLLAELLNDSKMYGLVSVYPIFLTMEKAKQIKKNLPLY